MVEHAEVTPPRGENRLTTCMGALGGVVQVPAARDARWRVPHTNIVVMSGLRPQRTEVVLRHGPRHKARRLRDQRNTVGFGMS